MVIRVNQSQLVQNVNNDLWQSKPLQWQHSFVVELLDSIIELAKERPLMIRQFGTFQRANLAARPGRHVLSGDKCVVPARSILKWKPSRKLVERLNDEE